MLSVDASFLEGVLATNRTGVGELMEDHWTLFPASAEFESNLWKITLSGVDEVIFLKDKPNVSNVSDFQIYIHRGVVRKQKECKVPTGHESFQEFGEFAWVDADTNVPGLEETGLQRWKVFEREPTVDQVWFHPVRE